MPRKKDSVHGHPSSVLDPHFEMIGIPSVIWKNPDLNWCDKVTAVEISLLDEEDNGCRASNRELAKRLGYAERSIQRSISQLKKLQLVTQESFDGRIRVLRSTYKIYQRRYNGE